MSVQRRTVSVVLILVLALAAACTAAQPKPPSAKAAAGVGGPVLAFIVDKTIMLSDKDGGTRRLITLTTDPEQLLWSPDGSRLAWTDSRNDPDGSDTVHVVDVATGAPKSYPCPCHGLAFLGEDLATVSTDGAHLVIFSPQGSATRVTFTKPITSPYTAVGAVASAEVVAGGRERVAVAVPLDEVKIGVRGQRTLYAVDRAGAVTPMLHGKQGASVWQGLASPAGDRIAWLDVPSSGVCWHDQRVVDMAYGKADRVDPAMPVDAPLRQAHLPNQRTVMSYSWAGTAVVQTFGPVGGECQVVYPFRLVSYYRQGAQWTHVATGLLGIAFGGNGRIAKLVPPNPIIQSTDGDRRYRGRLVLSVPGAADRTLSENVGYFAFTPAEAAMARIDLQQLAPTSTAPGSGPAITDDHGSALSGPLYEAARTVWSAAQTGNTADLLGLCRGCDAATQAWLRTDAGPAEVTRLLTSHPARTGNGLTYPGLAAAECADTSDSPATCTEQQLADVVALNIPEDVSLEYSAYVYRASKRKSLVFRLDAGKAVWSGRG